MAVTPEAISKGHVAAAESRLSAKKSYEHMAMKPESFAKSNTKSRLHNINDVTDFFRSKENEVQLPTFLDDNSPAALSATASAVAKAASEVADQSQEVQTDSVSAYHHYVIFKPTLPPSMPSDSIQRIGPMHEGEDMNAVAEDKGKDDELASIERRLKSLETLVTEMAESKGVSTPSNVDDTPLPETAARTASVGEGGEAEARDGSAGAVASSIRVAEDARASPEAAMADAADAAAGVSEEEGGSVTHDAREEGGARGDGGREEGGGSNPEADAAIEKALRDFAHMSKMAAAEDARRSG